MPRTTYQLGHAAEARCRLALRLKGYRILACRARTPMGEIDIIARRGQTVAMVEVKARPDLAQAAGAVSAQQQQRLGRAAASWLARQPRLASCTIRFDVMLVCPWRWPQHLANAWQPDR